MKKIATIKKIVFLSIMLVIMIGVNNNVFALQKQTEKVLGIETYKSISWTKLEGDSKQVNAGKTVKYNPGIQSNSGEIRYYNIIEGKDKIDVTVVNNGQYSYIQINGKASGTAKINVYYLPIGNMKYTGINNYSMKTLTVTVDGTGNTQLSNKTWYTITFLNSKGQNIKLGDQNLVLNRVAGDDLRMPNAPEQLKQSGFNLNEDISKYGEFEGWEDIKTGKIYKPGTQVIITSNCTFKAQFKEKKVENGKQDSVNNEVTNDNNIEDSSSSNIKIEEIKVNDTLTFAATSWKLYSDKKASKVNAYLLAGDKVKVLEVNDAKIPYILKVEVVSANKLKIGNIYYMKYGVSAKGNFKIEKIEQEESTEKEENVKEENKSTGLMETLLDLVKTIVKSSNAENQPTQVPQEENIQIIETGVNMIKTFAQIGAQLFNSLFFSK